MLVSLADHLPLHALRPGGVERARVVEVGWHLIRSSDPLGDKAPGDARRGEALAHVHSGPRARRRASTASSHRATQGARPPENVPLRALALEGDRVGPAELALEPGPGARCMSSAPPDTLLRPRAVTPMPTSLYPTLALRSPTERTTGPPDG